MSSFNENIVAQRDKIEAAKIPVEVVENFSVVSDEKIATTKKDLNIPSGYKFGIMSFKENFKTFLEKIPTNLKTVHEQQIKSEAFEINPNAEYAYVCVIDDDLKEVGVKCLVLRKGCFPTGFKYYVDYPMTNLYMFTKHRKDLEEFSESITKYFAKEDDLKKKDCEVVLRAEELLLSIGEYTCAELNNKNHLEESL